jgi:hypothetical protein
LTRSQDFSCGRCVIVTRPSASFPHRSTTRIIAVSRESECLSTGWRRGRTAGQR